METETICSDLLALAKLYALLGRSGDETPEPLDEKARLLLKDLLDGAAERVLRNHSEIIASKLGASDAKCCSQVEQGRATYDSVPSLSPDVSKHVHGVPQITRKDSKLRRADAVFNRNISSASLGTSYSCRACEWSGMGQLNDTNMNLNDQEQQIHVNGAEFFKQRRKAPDTFRSSEKPIQQRMQTPRELSIDDWVLSQTHSPVLGRDGLPGQITRQSSASRSPHQPSQLARRCRSPNQSMSRASSRWMNMNHVEEIESPSQNSHYLRGLRVPLRRDDPIPLKVHSRNIMDSSVKNYGKVVRSRAPVSSMASNGHAHKLTQIRPRGTKPRDKDLRHGRIISPTLLDHRKSGQVIASSDYSEASSQEQSWDGSKSYQSSHRKIVPYEEDYEETTSASLSSHSSWTGEQSNESEAYSSPSWTSQQSSASYDESEVFSSPKNHRQVGQTSKTKAHMRDDRSSCSERSHRRQSERNNGNVSPKMKRSNQQVKQEKGKGGLRKVKHMFGLIFQPFYHHRNRNDHVKEEQTKSNWKRVQKTTHSPKTVHSPSKKGEAGESRAIQVSRKPEGTKGAGKNQAGHLWGMLVHVNKAKKLKPPKGIGSGENMKALANKKLNGWQKLHHQTKVKLPSKGKPLVRKITLLDHQR